MAKGINKVFLLGHVGKDPEIRSSQSGTTFANFSLATAEREKDQGGNWVDKAEWHNLLAVGRTAEIVRDYVQKGSKLCIEGKLQTRSWDDKESGQKRYKTEIFITDLTLLGGGEQQEQRPTQGTRTQSATRPAAGGYTDYGDQGVTDEGIPF